MRGNNIHTRAARRVRTDHREVAIDEFDARYLCDGVHDDIVEDTQLALIEDAIATAEDVRDRRREELADDSETDHAAQVVAALEPLQATARERVLEICAERCRVVLVDGDDWLQEGWVEPDDLEAAKIEATNWLLEHGGVTKRLWGGDGPVEANHSANAGP